MSMQMGAGREPRQRRRRGFLAGVGAAVAMTVAMVVLRVATAVPSLPEVIGEAFISLMPAAVFSAILEALRTAAKPTLYVGILIGTLLVGGLLGRGFAYGPLTWRRALALATAIWAIFGLAVLPLLGLGVFGTNPRAGTVTMAVQLALVFGSFGGSLLLLLRALEPDTRPGVVMAERRAAILGMLAGLMAVAAVGTAWRQLLGGRAPTSTVGTETAAPGGPASESVDAAPSASPPAAVAEQPPAPAAAGSAPVRAAPRPDAPPVPMTVQPKTPAPAPFDVPNLSPEVTAAKEFYTVSKNLIDPTVDMSTWSLKVDGLVENPATYLYADIKALPAFSDYYTLHCISDTVGGDLWGNAHWKGVRLVEILSRAALKPGVRDVVFHADDGYTDSIPLEVATRPDTLLAYEMNGEQLPREHGYPARLLIPGIYGMKNVKWITRIELVDNDYKGFWAKQGWDDRAPYQTATRIDFPATRAQLPPGDVVVGGVTFAGFRGVDRVEISLDDGKTWEQAQVKPALALNSWNLWIFRKQLGPGTYTVKARAIDGTGEPQIQSEAEPFPSGSTGYHTILLRVG
ncbi:MAG: molybdopterin-dependent oxidoreductase [Chloroflexi bacterium]|nr:molybdopterin-dependent oxidoreductase [Chloroflexota bacterium]